MKRDPKVHTALICIGEGAEATWSVVAPAQFRCQDSPNAMQDHKPSSGPRVSCSEYCRHPGCFEEYINDHD